MTAAIIPFPCRSDGNPRGEIVIYPCEVDDGSWAVDHVSRSGDSAARIGEWFAYADAQRAAQAYAIETGADFTEAFDPEPRGAA